MSSQLVGVAANAGAFRLRFNYDIGDVLRFTVGATFTVLALIAIGWFVEPKPRAQNVRQSYGRRAMTSSRLMPDDEDEDNSKSDALVIESSFAPRLLTVSFAFRWLSCAPNRAGGDLEIDVYLHFFFFSPNLLRVRLALCLPIVWHVMLVDRLAQLTARFTCVNLKVARLLSVALRRNPALLMVRVVVTTVAAMFRAEAIRNASSEEIRAQVVPSLTATAAAAASGGSTSPSPSSSSANAASSSSSSSSSAVSKTASDSDVAKSAKNDLAAKRARSAKGACVDFADQPGVAL
jgi:hypothetical protein